MPLDVYWPIVILRRRLVLFSEISWGLSLHMDSNFYPVSYHLIGFFSRYALNSNSFISFISFLRNMLNYEKHANKQLKNSVPIEWMKAKILRRTCYHQRLTLYMLIDIFCPLILLVIPNHHELLLLHLTVCRLI